MKEPFSFQPISHSWVAVHPNPKGIVQFIGGAFFGSLPTVFYRYFLKTVFDEGYTLIALPFRFSFRHWPIAISLLQEQQILRQEITKIAKNLGYDSKIYQDKSNYFWVGHSLGCKYITLLEFLSGENWEEIVEECVGGSEYQYRQIEDSLKTTGLERPSIKGQPSLLIAPDISDTESAIPKPIAFVARFLDRLGLGVLPTKKQTKCFIERSNLFNLTALISFDKDTIAGNKINKNLDVFWFIEQLKRRKLPVLDKEIPGKHLEPIGIKIGNYTVDLNPLDKFIELIAERRVECSVIQFLEQLKQRAEQEDNVSEIDKGVMNVQHSAPENRAEATKEPVLSPSLLPCNLNAE